jgi:hypothetical protein
MNVARESAMQHTPGTACKTQVVTSTVFVILASQVSMRGKAGLDPFLSLIVADPPIPACPGPRCQTVLSPCESQPCQHGGQCRLSSGPGGGLTFTCHCVQVGRVAWVAGSPWGKKEAGASGNGVDLGEKWKGKGML